MKAHFSFLLAAAAQFNLATFPAWSHPGSGIVVDRQGEIYFVDTGSGVGEIDTHGTLIQISGPRFHWMTMDADERLRDVRLPSASGWGNTRGSAKPTPKLAQAVSSARGREWRL